MVAEDLLLGILSAGICRLWPPTIFLFVEFCCRIFLIQISDFIIDTQQNGINYLKQAEAKILGICLNTCMT